MAAQEIIRSTTVTQYSYHLLEINLHNLAAVYFEGLPSYTIYVTTDSSKHSEQVHYNGNIGRTAELNSK